MLPKNCFYAIFSVKYSWKLFNKIFSKHNFAECFFFN